jgi:hypothetical protein
MSESIAEMVVPGTFIEVRSEGLIAVGSIAVGVIGIVGTAARGPLETAVSIGAYSEALDTFGPADLVGSPAEDGTPLSLTRALEQAYAGGAKNVVAVRVANGAPTAATLPVKNGADTLFTLTASSAGSWGNQITVAVANDDTPAVGPAPAVVSRRMTIVYRNTREVFSGATADELRTALAASNLVAAGDLAAPAAATKVPDVIAPAAALTGGTSHPNVSSLDIDRGLAVLEDEQVNILLVAGLGADRVAAVVGGHLERTENDAHERIAILGVRGPGTATDPSLPLTDTSEVSDDRIVLVSPGIQVEEPQGDTTVRRTLAPSYTAAIVAGALSALAPQVSLTNRALPIQALDVQYSSAALQRLLQERVLLVRRKFGFQVVRALTTDRGAFTQISVRRTVDYAKAGVRSGADPYIGKLNNARVRAALKATLDGFLSQMVVDEMLTGYALEVTATRAQEIRGIAAVTMTLQPTFSIDFIRVTMNLQ